MARARASGSLKSVPTIACVRSSPAGCVRLRITSKAAVRAASTLAPPSICASIHVWSSEATRAMLRISAFTAARSATRASGVGAGVGIEAAAARSTAAGWLFSGVAACVLTGMN